MSSRIDSRARELVTAKQSYQKLKQSYEAAEREYREIEHAFWLDLEEELGKIKTVTLDLGDGFGTWQLQRRETITATVLNPEELAAALEAEGEEGAVGGPSIRKRVLNQIVRDRLKAGQALPSGADFHPRRYITATKK